MENKNIVNIGGLDCYEENGVAYLNLEQAARGLGIVKVDRKNGAEYTRIHKPNLQKWLFDFGLTKSEKVELPAYIPENIFYRLAMKAKNEAAEKFQAWVADEVIPAIRKTGGYIRGSKDMSDLEIMSKAFMIAQRTIETRDADIRRLEATVDEQRREIAAFAPVRGYVDEILSSPGTLTTTQIAADYGLSARKLNDILHDEKIQHKVNGQWILYKEQMEKGYTKSVTIQIKRSDGTPDTKMHTQWTQKGRLMIHGILTRRGVLANVDVEAG